MRIGIVGATSGTGRQFLEQAHARGHRLTAIVRRPEALADWADRVEVRAADVRSVSSLVEAVPADLDVLIALFGASGLLEARKVTDLYSTGTANLVTVLRAKGIQRIVSVSSGGVEPQPNDPWFFRKILKPLFLDNMYEDMRRMEAGLRASDLAWTIVRPPYLTNGPLTGRYRTSRGRNFDDDKTLSRADLAHFLVAVAEGDDWERVLVAVSE